MSSSASINKKICCLFGFLFYPWEWFFGFFSTFFVFGMGLRILATFKMELFVTKGNDWKLLLLLQKAPFYMWVAICHWKQDISQEGKQFCILDELGNKTQLEIWVHFEPLNGFSGRFGGKAFEKIATFSLKLVWYSFSK